MVKIAVILILALSLFCSTSVALAQKTKNIMTNSDVIELVKAGLEESTIILAIQQSDPNFDTSTEALAELEELGVSPGILAAIRQKQSEAQLPNEILPGIYPNEVLLIDGGKEIKMMRHRVEERFIKGDLIFVFFSRLDLVLEGRQSQLRVADRMPEFQASLPSDLDPAEILLIVKLKQKSDRREVKVPTSFRTASRKDFKKKAIVPTTFEAVSNYSVDNGTRYTIYRVKVVSPLPPGEYAFVPRSYPIDFFDFGIDSK